MYDRCSMPRLVRFHDLPRDEPHLALKQSGAASNDIYAGELGEPFTTTAGCALYRDGNDSVAWHGGDIDRRAGTGEPPWWPSSTWAPRGPLRCGPWRWHGPEGPTPITATCW